MNLRQSFRTLLRDPGFAVVAIVVLALGIGANTAMFSVVNAVLLRPLPYQNAGRLVAVNVFWMKQGEMSQNVSWPDFVDYEQQNRSFDALAIYGGGSFSVMANNQPERLTGTFTTEGFFRVLGVQAALGRVLNAAENQPGGAAAAVISDRMWHETFNADPNVLGKTIKMFDRPFTIVGVMPAGFRYPDDTDVWFTHAALNRTNESRSGHNYFCLARLKPGATLVQAQAEMEGIAARLAKQYPENGNKSVRLIPMQQQETQNVRLTLVLLMGAVSLVLLIACGNVANLLLARVMRRRQEMAIRAALGATRIRIVKQLLSESCALALPAAGLGVLLGAWAAEALSHMAAANLPRFAHVGLDWRVALFTIVAAAGSTLLFGVAPGWHASRVDLNDALRSSGGYNVAGGASRLRSAIVVGEIALSMVLLLGSVLLFRSLIALSSVDPGFRTQSVEVMDVRVNALGLEAAQRAVKFYDGVIDAAASMAEIEQISATNLLPGKRGANGSYEIEGRPKPAEGDFFSQAAQFIVIAPRYFRLLGIPQMSGRDFDARDSADAPLVCLINSALARQVFPKEDPIGKRIQTGLDGTGYMTVVGVVGDERHLSLTSQPPPIIYMPFDQHPKAAGMKLLYRSRTDSASANAALRKVVAQMNPEATVAWLPLSETLESSLAPPRFRTLLLSLFASLAVVLALVGLYAVMSYSVAQRAREIGVRMALGAAPAQITGMILRQGLTMIVPGMVLGIVLALAAGSLIRSLVFGVTPGDPITFAVVAALLLAISLVAMLVPARRAASLDPLQALRQE